MVHLTLLVYNCFMKCDSALDISIACFIFDFCRTFRNQRSNSKTHCNPMVKMWIDFSTMNEKNNLLKIEEHMYILDDVKKPNVFRNMFPYEDIPKIPFNDRIVPHNMPRDIWITDTTFRDGQQSRAPYSTEQIIRIYDMLHEMADQLQKMIDRQSELREKSKEIKRLKNRLMGEIIGLRDRLGQEGSGPVGQAAEKKLKEHTRLIAECNDRLESQQDELIELPRNIYQLNYKLMLATMQVCYERMHAGRIGKGKYISVL